MLPEPAALLRVVVEDVLILLAAILGRHHLELQHALRARQAVVRERVRAIADLAPPRDPDQAHGDEQRNDQPEATGEPYSDRKILEPQHRAHASLSEVEPPTKSRRVRA